MRLAVLTTMALLLVLGCAHSAQLDFRISIPPGDNPSWVDVEGHIAPWASDGPDDYDVLATETFPGDNIAFDTGGRTLVADWRQSLTSTWTGRLWFEDYLVCMYTPSVWWWSDVPGMTFSAAFTDEWGTVTRFDFPRMETENWFSLYGLTSYTFTISAVVVPEPPAYLLFGSLPGMIALYRRRPVSRRAESHRS